MNSIFRNLKQRNHQPVSVHKVGKSAERNLDKIFRCHSDATTMVVNGEGVIHHDRKHAFGLAALGARAAEAGLTAHLINAALFDNSPILYKKLRHFSSVWVRDGESLIAARENGVDAQFAPDLSFDGIAALNLPNLKRSGSLITDSVDPSLTEKLEHLASKAHCQWQPMRRNVPLPFGRLSLMSARYFLRRIRNANFVITGRFHAAAACIATSTPFAALPSNTRKIESLLHDVFGSQQRLLSRSSFSTLINPDSIAPAFDEREKIAIAAYLERARLSIARMFDQLSA